MLIVNQDNLRISSTTRLVKRADIQTISEVMDILSDAHREADAIRQQAQNEFESQKQLGYDKGMEIVKKESAIRKFEQVEEAISYLNSMENKIVEIVLTALRKCIAEIGNRELLVQVIIKAMQSIMQKQQQATLKVSPDMLPVIQERLHDILAKFPGVNYINLMDDVSLKGVECILETDAGNVNASLEVQLSAIETTLKKCFTR